MTNGTSRNRAFGNGTGDPEHGVRIPGATVPHREIMETLRLAEQGYRVVRSSRRQVAVRPLPWRRILHQLPALGPDKLLEVAFGANGSGDGVVVRRIAAAGPADQRAAAAGARGTRCAMSVHEGLRANARMARHIEMAVRTGECRRVIVHSM